MTDLSCTQLVLTLEIRGRLLVSSLGSVGESDRYEGFAAAALLVRTLAVAL